jgi:hypothetical protein
MKAMFWHGGGGLDAYVDSPEFEKRSRQAIDAKFRANPLIQGLSFLFPDFLLEQSRQMAYYSGLGQFWRVMSDMFLELSELYNQGKITTIPQVVELIQSALVKSANLPITYSVNIRGKSYEIIPNPLV